VGQPGDLGRQLRDERELLNRTLPGRLLGTTIAALLPVAGATGEAETFTLTDAHLQLIRSSIVAWAPIEAGAPAVLCSPLLVTEDSEHPSAALYADVAARAGLKLSSPPSDADRRRIDELMRELPQALAQLVQRASLQPGTYSYRNPLVGSLQGARAPDGAEGKAAESVTFDYTPDHAKLLRHANWRGLFMDPKRPYGEMTFFELDMAEILGESVPRAQDGAPSFAPGQQERYDRLHAQMLEALQVFLVHARMRPGAYPRVPSE